MQVSTSRQSTWMLLADMLTGMWVWTAGHGSPGFWDTNAWRRGLGQNTTV